MKKEPRILGQTGELLKPITIFSSETYMEQINLSTTLTEDTLEIPIPYYSFDPEVHNMLLFVNSTFISPRIYEIDIENKKVVLNSDQEVLREGKVIDFIFTSIQKKE